MADPLPGSRLLIVADRTEGAALSGTLHLVIGGRPRELAVLKIKQSREWKAKLGDVAKGIELDDDLGVTIARLANLASEVALDLLVAYDLQEVLGGREAIEEQATDPELFAALEELVKVTYPFADRLRSVAEAFGPQLREIAMRLTAAVAASLSRANFTPMLSGTGDSTPTPSASDSPTSSSSSSGPTTSKRVNGTHASSAT